MDAVKPQSQFYNESAVEPINPEDLIDTHRDNPVTNAPTLNGSVTRYQTQVRRISIRNDENLDSYDNFENARPKYTTEA